MRKRFTIYGIFSLEYINLRNPISAKISSGETVEKLTFMAYFFDLSI